MFPNTICVGAAKSATTSFYHYLKDHPQVLMSSRKEGCFFSGVTRGVLPSHYHYDVPVYREEYESFYKGFSGEKIIAEASPDYFFFHEDTIPNILNYCGRQIKIICILRNPVERAFSHYKQNVRLKAEDLSFSQALEAENIRLREGYCWVYQYRSNSLYFDRLKAYIDAFDRVKVFVFEEVINDVNDFMQHVHDFLDIAPRSIEPKVWNSNSVPVFPFMDRFYKKIDRARAWCHTKPKLKLIDRKLRGDLLLLGVRKLNPWKTFKLPLDSNIKRELFDYFQDDINQLEKLLGRDLDLWKPGN